MSDSSDFRRLEIPGLATFSDGPGDLPRVTVRTAQAEAELFLHGAQLTRFQPAGAEPVIFMSQRSSFECGKAIRGGVPICFPWFGPRAGHPESPMHGFARTREWEIESLQGSATDGVKIALRLASGESTRALWPHDFVARFIVAIGAQLSMTLEIENISAAPFPFEAALHTYFAVSDVREVSVTGLENATYLDKTDGFTRKQLDAEPLRFTGETDRIFPGTTTVCVIHDPGLRRKTVVGKSGSATTVVWNPWTTKAAAMADFGDDEWLRMVCIESANTGDDAILLTPHAKHALTQTIHLITP
jgi:D-hexose-6-phosphate mutarotase